MRIEDDRKCVLIQCKVSTSVAARLEELCKEYGFKSKYNILQYLVSAFLRVADCNGKIQEEDEDIAEFAKMFEGFENARERVMTVNPSRFKSVRLCESVNLYKVIGSKGHVCKVLTAAGDNLLMNSSENKALDVVIKRLFPRLYNKLKAIAEQEEENRIERVLEALADEWGNGNEDATYIGSEFAKKDGSNTYGIVPKKKRGASINDKG